MKTQTINLSLDLTQSRSVDVAPGITATVAPDRDTGRWKVALLHYENSALTKNMRDFVADRVKDLNYDEQERRLPVQEAKRAGGSEGFEGFFEEPKNTLVGDRRIQVTEFNTPSMESFINNIMRLDQDPSKPIVILVTSDGGLVESLFGMLGFAAVAKSPIYTVVVDRAYSCGAVLAAAAAPRGNRFATAHADIMVHEIFGGVIGQMPDAEAGIEDMKRTNDRLFQILGAVTDINVDGWRDIVRNKAGKRDHYYYPDEAIEIGLVDKVLDTDTYNKLMVGGTK